MPNESLLLLEVLERVLTYIELLLVTKRLWVWRVVPCINVVPPQLNNLQTTDCIRMGTGMGMSAN